VKPVRGDGGGQAMQAAVPGEPLTTAQPISKRPVKQIIAHGITVPFRQSPFY
jgi:hypothetical protein